MEAFTYFMISNTDNGYLSWLIGTISPSNPTDCAWSDQCLENTYDIDSLMDLITPFLMLQISVESYVADKDSFVSFALLQLLRLRYAVIVRRN